LAIFCCVFYEKKIFNKALSPKTSIKAAQNLDELNMSSQPKHLPDIGSYGITYCSLRPHGKVLIEDHLYDAKSCDDTIILKKKKIIVVGQDTGALLVKEVLT
jgi:membrane-bound ClpP family serine protease